METHKAPTASQALHADHCGETCRVFLGTSSRNSSPSKGHSARITLRGPAGAIVSLIVGERNGVARAATHENRQHVYENLSVRWSKKCQFFIVFGEGRHLGQATARSQVANLGVSCCPGWVGSWCFIDPLTCPPVCLRV